MPVVTGLRREYESTDAALALEYHEKRLALAKTLLLPKAQAGDRLAALCLIGFCSDAIGDGVVVEPMVADWLAAILLRIAGGVTIEEAAGIPKRPKGKKREQDATAARGRRYFMAHQYGVRFRHERMKGIAAQAEVAELFGVDTETVRSAWKKYKVGVVRDIENELRALGKVLKITSLQKVDDKES